MANAIIIRRGCYLVRAVKAPRRRYYCMLMTGPGERTPASWADPIRGTYCKSLAAVGQWAREQFRSMEA